MLSDSDVVIITLDPSLAVAQLSPILQWQGAKKAVRATPQAGQLSEPSWQDSEHPPEILSVVPGHP
jgi:hypothetical protein